MHLTIRHDTIYKYASPVQYTIQQLRLTPYSGPAQIVRRWQLDVPGKVEVARDAYGNVMHTLVLSRPHSEISLRVAGEVDTIALVDGRLNEGPGPIALEHFTCATPLTEADDAIVALARMQPTPARPDGLILLAERIAERVVYHAGITEVTTPAADALALGNGVCQDHAHLMLACCRALGLPARYVSGYIDPGDVPHAASHAWVHVWLDAQGWVSVDVTHACFASERYCRLAVARDYETAAPVRGTRVGGKEEKLNVAVFVNAESAQQ